MAAICAATSVPVLTTFSSFTSGFTSGASTKAFAVLIIWMRQVLPTKPLASAMRYGPSFFDHWKNFVSAAYGLKHSGSVLGPLAICGPLVAGAVAVVVGSAVVAGAVSVVSGASAVGAACSAGFLKINQPPIAMTATMMTPISVFIWLLMSSGPPSRCAG